MAVKKGAIIVLSGPSGVGKGLVCRQIRSVLLDLQLSISATSRPSRPQEMDGVDYFFVSPERFKEMIERQELLEWAVYNGHYYGTPKAPVECILAQGKSVLLEIEVQGALQIKRNFPQAHLVFLLPPNEAALQERLTKRGANSPEDIEARMVIAREEIKQKSAFDYTLVNDDLTRCVEKLIRFIQNISSQDA